MLCSLLCVSATRGGGLFISGGAVILSDSTVISENAASDVGKNLYRLSGAPGPDRTKLPCCPPHPQVTATCPTLTTFIRPSPHSLDPRHVHQTLATFIGPSPHSCLMNATQAHYVPARRNWYGHVHVHVQVR